MKPARFNHRIAILLLGMLLGLPGLAMAQSSFLTARGIVVDAKTKEPIPFLTVFVPNTTIATLTNEKGEFTLTKIPMSTTELAFSHLSYGFIKEWLASALSKGSFLNISLNPKVFDFKEVEIVGDRDRAAAADRRYYLSIFYQYFLGDTKNYECKLVNPESVRFRKEGDRVIASAAVPLIIQNLKLGYTLTYYLDYFIFNDTKQFRSAGKNQCFFTYQGVALFEEMKPESAVRTELWNTNRHRAYAGSLGNFLSCLYGNDLHRGQYTVLKAVIPDSITVAKWLGSLEAQANRPKFFIDSVFYYNEAAGQPGYLPYAPQFPFPIFTHTVQTEKPFCRSLKCNDSLLVFKNKRDPAVLWDDEISLFVIGKGELEFYPNGDYQIFNGDLLWSSLESMKKIIQSLPMNFQPGSEGSK